MDKHVAVRRFGISLLAAGAALLVSSVASAHPTVGVRSAPTFRAQNWTAPAHRDSTIILHVAACRSSKRTVAVSGGGASNTGAGGGAQMRADSRWVALRRRSLRRSRSRQGGFGGVAHALSWSRSSTMPSAAKRRMTW